MKRKRKETQKIKHNNYKKNMTEVVDHDQSRGNGTTVPLDRICILSLLWENALWKIFPGIYEFKMS